MNKQLLEGVSMCTLRTSEVHCFYNNGDAMCMAEREVHGPK